MPFEQGDGLPEAVEYARSGEAGRADRTGERRAGRQRRGLPSARALRRDQYGDPFGDSLNAGIFTKRRGAAERKATAIDQLKP